MKTFPLISTLLCALPVAIASPRAFLSPPKSHIAETALTLRGGDHISKVISPEGLTKFATVYFTYDGTFGAADAAKYWEPFGLKIQPNSLAAWAGENNGFVPMGVALMSYLSLFTDMAPLKIVATAATLCCFFMFKSCYSGTLLNLGFWPGFGTLCTTSIFIPICMALADKGDPDIVSVFLWLPPLVWGVLGLLSPEDSLKIFGLKGFGSATDKLLWKFQCMALTMWGVQALTLIKGGSAMEAMKWVFTSWAASVVDVRFLRPIYRDAGFMEAGANAFTVFVLLMTALFYVK